MLHLNGDLRVERLEKKAIYFKEHDDFVDDGDIGRVGGLLAGLGPRGAVTIVQGDVLVLIARTLGSGIIGDVLAHWPFWINVLLLDGIWGFPQTGCRRQQAWLLLL